MVETRLKFDEAYFNEEERLGFYITRKRKEVWAIELDLLYYLDQVCKKHNLKYYLDSGTLLGAVRHKGFIPWDDDVDVVMLRADYNKLIEISSKEFYHPYFFQHAYTDIGYSRWHAQIRNSNTCGALEGEFLQAKFNQGIFIDVFVLDRLPEEEDKLNERNYQLTEMMKVIQAMTAQVNMMNMIPQPIEVDLNGGGKFRFENLMHAYKLYDEIAQKYEDNGGGYLSFNNKFRREWFGEPKYLEFEGIKFPVPTEYELVLKAWYGEDYMTPRISGNSHGRLIIDTNRSYKEILRDLYL